MLYVGCNNYSTFQQLIINATAKAILIKVEYVIPQNILVK